MAGEEILKGENLLKISESYPGEIQQNQSTTGPVKKNKKKKNKKRKSKPNERNIKDSILNTNLVQGEKPEENFPQASEKDTEVQIPTANSDSLVTDPISNTNLVQGGKLTAEGNIPCTNLESFSEGQILNSNICTKTDLPVQNTNSSKDEKQTSTKITGTRPKIPILSSNLAEGTVQIPNTNSAQRDNTHSTKKYLFDGYKEPMNMYNPSWDPKRNPYRNASSDARQNQYRNASLDPRQNPYRNAFWYARENQCANAFWDAKPNPCTNASLDARQNPCTNASLDARQNPYTNASLDARQNPCTNASWDAGQNPCTNASWDAGQNSNTNAYWDKRQNPYANSTTRNDLLFQNTNLASRYHNEDAGLWDEEHYSRKNSNSSDTGIILNTNSTQGTEGQIFNANSDQGCGRPLQNPNSSLIAEGEITYANQNLLRYRQISNPNTNIYLPPLNQPNSIQGNAIGFQNSILPLQEISNSYLVPIINEQILSTNIAPRSQFPNQNSNTSATTNLQVSYTNSASWDGITDTAARTELQVPQANGALWDVGDVPNSNLFLSELSEELRCTNNASWNVNQNPNTYMTAGADLLVPCTPWWEIDNESEIDRESETVGECTYMWWSEGEQISRMNLFPIGQILSTNPTEVAAEQIANTNSSQQTGEQIQNTNATEWSDFQGSTTNLASRDGRENQNTNTPIRDGGQFSSKIMSLF